MESITITLTIEQIKNLAEWAGLYVTAPEIIDMETEITVQEDRTSIKAYFTEYPDEGAFKL